MERAGGWRERGMEGSTVTAAMHQASAGGEAALDRRTQLSARDNPEGWDGGLAETEFGTYRTYGWFPLFVHETNPVL